MEIIRFNKKKYSTELPFDLGKFEESPVFNWGDTPHTVDFYEIFFFEKAKGTLQLDHQVIELKDNLLVYASPFQRRKWKVNRGEISGHYLIFSNNFLEMLFADALFVFRLKFFHNYETPLYMEERPDSKMRHQHAFSSIKYELENLKEDSEDFIRAFLLLILAGHNRRYCEQYGLSPARNFNDTGYLFKKSIETSIKTNPKVEDLARELNISRISLNKHVKAKFGVTANEMINNRMLTEIQRELLFSDKTISEIAYDLNFSEPHHLNRFFKRMTNKTPTEFRGHYQMG